jgi:Uncharacterized protein containing LysM domain
MKIYITQGADRIILPINPEKLRLTEKSKNKEQSVLGLGDVNIPDVRGLNEIKFDSFFPFAWNYYCNVGQAELRSPIEYVNLLMKFKNSKKPVNLVIAGNMQNILKANGNASGLFLIEGMDYEIRAGEENDIYYSIALKQYRSYEPAKIEVKNNIVQVQTSTTPVSKPTLTVQPQARPIVATATIKVKQYTVVSGDNLWNIARKYYGDGNRYTEIARANNLSNPSLIYPGQKLVIP